MRNLKKLLAVIVTIAMLATFAIPAFAADTAATTTTTAAVKTDADICKDLGVLKGDGSDFTTYLTQETTRIQAATLYLRLLGKEAEAYAYTGTTTFKDAGLVKYANGKALLAYLKANPDLGWVGDGINFNPNSKTSAKELYKVMLVALGYTVGDGKDFKYDDSVKFAGEKGLTKAATLTAIKNSDTASVLVETLKAKLKDGSKTLLADLITKKVIDEKIAETTGMVASATVSSVVAIDATTIKVTFDKTVTAVAADFKVVDSASKDMAVSSIAMADANKTVVLKIAEMTVGSKYTLTYGATSKDVVPTAKDDTTKPALASAEAITGTLVRATFSTRNLNQDTLVAANFTLDNSATISAIKLDTAKMAETGQETNTVVLFTVSGLKQGKAFVLTSSKVASYEGAVATTSTATFAGKDADTTAPGITYAKSNAGYQVELKFDEAGIVNETALDIANYSITPTLTVKAAKWKKNELGNNIVILTTDDQKVSTAYTISVNKISDGTNVMSTAKTFTFAGVDKVKNQALDTAVATDATKVLVTFKYEANDTALAIANYTMNNSITVTSAAFKVDTSDVDGLDQYKVILTTSAMKASTAYTLTVGTGVQDTLGQGLSAAATATFAGKDPDTSFGSVSAVSAGKNSITVTFGEEVDRATATTLANYKVSDLGYPSSVSLDSTNKIATLTVADQTTGKSYTITFNNIKDLAGNVITANTTTTFTGKGDTLSDLRVTSARAMSKDKIKVTFNQTVTGDADAGDFTLANTTTSGKTYSFNNPAEINTAQNYIILTIGSTEKMSSSDVFKVTFVDATGSLAGAETAHTINADYDDATFVGSSDDLSTFTISTVTAIDKTHIKLTFDQALVGTPDATSMYFYSASDYTGIAKNTDSQEIANAFDPVEVISTDKKSVILSTNKAMDDSKVYYVDFDNEASFVTEDGSTLAVASTSVPRVRLTIVTGTLVATTATELDISSATMMDNNTLQVVFNTDTNEALAIGEIGIYKDSAVATELVASATNIVFTDSKTAMVYFANADVIKGNDNGIYYFKIDATNSVRTVPGNSATFASGKNIESFALNTATNAAPAISLVEPLTAKKIKVTVSEKILNATGGVAIADTDEAFFVIYNDTTNAKLNPANYDLTLGTGADAGKVFYIELHSGAFLAGGNYRIGLTSGVYGIDKVVTAKTYAPSTSETDNSIQFGGITSATTTIVPTVTTNTLAAPVIDFNGDVAIITAGVVTEAANADVLTSKFTITSTAGTPATQTNAYTSATDVVTFAITNTPAVDDYITTTGIYDLAGNLITYAIKVVDAGTDYWATK